MSLKWDTSLGHDVEFHPGVSKGIMPNLTRLGGVAAKCIGLQLPVPTDVQGDSGKSVPLSGLQFSHLPSGVPK